MIFMGFKSEIERNNYFLRNRKNLMINVSQMRLKINFIGVNYLYR